MLPQIAQIQILVPFAEPAAVGRQQHGHMTVGGMGKAKQLLQIHLPGRRAQQILTPHHLRDTGFAVIHGHCQLIHIDPVRPAHHKIAAIGDEIFPIGALSQILHHPLSVRNHHPPGRLPVKGGSLVIGQVSAGAGVHISAVGQMGCVYIVQLAASAVAGVQKLQVCQPFKISVVDGAALGLGSGLQIPVKTQPLQILPQNPGIFIAGTLGIQILHAQHQCAIPAADRQPGHQCGKYIAQMHPSRRRGRKAPDHFTHKAPSFR